MNDFSFLGFGCGLRQPHWSRFLKDPPDSIDWVEVIAENFLDWSDERKLRSARNLQDIRKNFPVAVHGVSLSLGSTDPLDYDHLKRLRRFLKEVDAAWFSDHLCWTGVQGTSLHDLMPLPYTEEALRVVTENILRTQDFLGRRLLIENVSSYIRFHSSQMTEWEFLNEVLHRADCGLLLDVNNVYVTAKNHGFDPLQYLQALDLDRVGQIHLAGHETQGRLLVDTHGQPVCQPVWELYEWVIENCGQTTTLVEWDSDIPKWSVLEAQVVQARGKASRVRNHVISSRHPATL